MKLNIVRTMPDGETIELEFEDASAVDVISVVESIFGSTDDFPEIHPELLH